MSTLYLLFVRDVFDSDGRFPESRSDGLSTSMAPKRHMPYFQSITFPMNRLHLGNSTPANRHWNIVGLVQSRGRILYSGTTVGEDPTSEKQSGSESGSTFWSTWGFAVRLQSLSLISP